MVSPKKKYPRYRSYELIFSCSIATPASRVVIVQAWHCEDVGESGYVLMPVLAIKSSVVDVYDRMLPDSGHDNARYSPDHKDMVRFGWEYSSREEREKYLVNDPELGVTDVDISCEGSNVAWRAVACPWPPSEDEYRLAKVIAEVREEASEKVRLRELERRRALAKSPAIAGIEVGP